MDTPIGFAAANALGQNGTTGGAARPTVTVTNATDLAHYAGDQHPVHHPGIRPDQKSGPGRLVERNNIYVSSGVPETAGSVVEPRTYYPYTLDGHVRT